MLDHFETIPTTATNPEGITPPRTMQPCRSKKHRHPKKKKALKKALKKLERECDTLYQANGCLALENSILKRSIMLATAASKRKLDDELTSNTLALLPRNER